MTVTESPTRPPSPGRRDAGDDSFLLPDGSRVTIAAPDLDTSGIWNCLFMARTAGTRESFSVAPRRDDRAQLHGLTDTTVHPYRDAELLVGYDPQRGEMLASWRGPWHEVVNLRTGPRIGSDRFVRLFDAFRITDTQDGVRMAPRRAVEFEPFHVFKIIPGVGDLHIQRPHEADTPAPAWRGAPARHGEIWRKEGTDNGEVKRARKDTLILGTTNAIAELIANPGDTADDGAAAEFLTTLNITWSTP
ncbi:MAG: hypothetical protein ACRDT4_03420 [Micromonosporaceae bacterium]